MSVHKKMIELLEEERVSLLSGALEEALGLQNQKLEYLKALELGSVSGDEVNKIRRLAERNASLIDAARRGVASAIRTLEDPIDNAALNTYSAKGDQDAVEHGAPRLQLRL